MAEENGTSEQPYPGLNEQVLAAIREAIRTGMAELPYPTPQVAPPQVTPTMGATPLLQLRLPAPTDLALIEDLNWNFGILDGSVTVDQAATLTNKTLVAPIISNPTITGWTNAQHSHLDGAGAGQLDGAAIVSGDIGTGFLTRESHVADAIAGVIGGGADLVAPVLIDAVVRDTLWWGDTAEPTPGAPDTSLKRTAANALQLGGDIDLIRTDPGTLRLNSHLGLGADPWPGDLTPAPQQNMLRMGGTAGATAYTTDGIEVFDNTYWDGTKYVPVAWAKKATQVVLASGNLYVKTAPVLAHDDDTQVLTSRLVLEQAGTVTLTPTTTPARAAALVAQGPVGVGVVPATDWMPGFQVLQIGQTGALQGEQPGTNTYLTANSVYSTTAPSGNKAIVAGGGSSYNIGAGVHNWFTAPSVAAGAAQVFVERMTITNAGEMRLSPDTTGLTINKPNATGYAIDSQYGDVILRRGASINLANVANSASGGWRWREAGGGLEYVINGAPIGTVLAQNGDLLVKGSVTSIASPGENLAGMWVADTAGTRKAFQGLEGDYGTWRVYSSVTPGNSLTVNLANHYVSIPGGLGVSGGITNSAAYASNGSVGNFGATANIQLSPAGGYVHPDGNNNRYLGHPTLNWGAIYVNSVIAPGQLSMNSGPSTPVVISSGAGHHVYIRGASEIYMDTRDQGIVAPEASQRSHLGSGGNRWKGIYLNNNPDVSSSIHLKEDWDPLPPGLALRTLRRVTFGRFTYKDSPRPGDDDPLGQRRWDEHALIRRQVGLLAEPTVEATAPVGGADLFVSGTGISTNAQQTACSVGSAVQDLDGEVQALRQRLEALEQRMAA